MMLMVQQCTDVKTEQVSILSSVTFECKISTFDPVHVQILRLYIEAYFIFFSIHLGFVS